MEREVVINPESLNLQISLGLMDKRGRRLSAAQLGDLRDLIELKHQLPRLETLLTSKEQDSEILLRIFNELRESLENRRNLSIDFTDEAMRHTRLNAEDLLKQIREVLSKPRYFVRIKY